MASWNDPIFITGPISSLQYGSNNNTQRLLINDTEQSISAKIGGAEEYNNTYFKKLVAYENFGLE